MKIRNIFLAALLSLASVTASAQFGGLKGRVASRVGRAPIADATVTVTGPETASMHTSDRGEFMFEDLPSGTYILVAQAQDFEPLELTVKVMDEMRDMGLVIMNPEIANLDSPDDMVEFESASESDGQMMPSVLAASRDTYSNIMSYTFSQMRFRNRGFKTSTSDTYINGLYFNDAMNGYGPYSLIGGLNEASRSKESSSSIGALDWGLGGVNYATNIDMRPSAQRKGLRVSAVVANSMYRTRLMASYASGFNDSGWAYAFSVSTRQGGGDWVDGVSYNTLSYYAGVEKRLSDAHRVSLTVFGAPTVRGVSAAAVQEVYDLTGDHYYNPNWGYIGGKMRNARQRDFHEPVAILNYVWQPDHATKLDAAASFRFGRNGYSAFDWYDGLDPKPDYYRNLPSYYGVGMKNENEIKFEQISESWATGSFGQVDWEALYDRNRHSTFGGNPLSPNTGLIGAINANNADQIDAATLRSNYIIEDRRTDQRDLSAKVQFSRNINRWFTAIVGLNGRINTTHYFKTMKDLMGGQYWLDIDKFVEEQASAPDDQLLQTDADHPLRLINEGDTYGYNYNAHLQSGDAWTLWRYRQWAVEAYLGAQLGMTSFWREGIYNKGLFADTPGRSKGNSEKQNFFTCDLKAGLVWKLSGAHNISVGGAYQESAPYFQDAFAAPRTRNDVAPNITTEKRLSADVTYTLRMPWVKARVTGFYGRLDDQMRAISFYDDIQRAFSNLSLSGMDQQHLGVELGVDVPLPFALKGLSIKGAASIGEYVYSSNPIMNQYFDNTGDELGGGRVWWSGYHVGGTPQTAASLGLSYRGSGHGFFNGLFVDLTASYYARNYIDISPIRRTDGAREGADYLIAGTTDQSAIAGLQGAIDALWAQEKFGPAFLLGASVNKLWYLGSHMLGVSLSVNNILNNQNIRSGGFEQMRMYADVNKSSGDHNVYVPFASKYYYLYGASYYLNVYFRF
ncbi:MAG: TonB-dependent receptor [Rikenellaceae bacterium]|jgi:hypothetical protein|nr:TonB-dependent receptor [Rikenellaceae bacterium]